MQGVHERKHAAQKFIYVLKKIYAYTIMMKLKYKDNPNGYNFIKIEGNNTLEFLMYNTQYTQLGFYITQIHPTSLVNEE